MSGVAVGPPTRGPDSENFPVASLLLARAMRPKVLAFYRFVRTADDIADDPVLPPLEKLARLARLEAGLDDPVTTLPEAAGLHAAGTGSAEARQMLAAFRQDAVQARYADWPALEAYCATSAVPVGRLLLRLHGEAAGPDADALCTALQILNHLQDLAEDRAALGRVYLPQDWLAAAGGEATFFADPAARRPVLDAALDRVEAALETAAGLPRRLASRRLALESAVTLGCARRLLARLRATDPVLGRVALSRADTLAALAAAPVPPRDAAIVRARVGRSGSSFRAGMAVLPAGRRRGLHAVYAFCRAVDDIADGAAPLADRRRALDGWRAKLQAPDCALSRELARACRAHDLPAAECEAMIAGMAADAAPAPRIADAAGLDLYCRQVAGSVGAMAVRIFGAPEAVGFGLDLGRTLQLVNILRDLDEDAARDRLYLPLSLLPGADAGLPATTLLALPAMPGAAMVLARQAEAGFAAADAALVALGHPRALLPARIMMWGYRRLLARMLAQGFAAPRVRPRLNRAEKGRMALWAARWPMGRPG